MTSTTTRTAPLPLGALHAHNARLDPLTHRINYRLSDVAEPQVRLYTVSHVQ